MSKVLLGTNLKRRKTRVRAKVWGTAECPRLSVRRTNTRMIAQLINDSQKLTLAYTSDLDLAKVEAKKTKSERAFQVGKLLAKKALKVGLKKAIFDRNGYLYHGRVKRLAEGAREGGLVL